jgi:hypothetical protein
MLNKIEAVNYTKRYPTVYGKKLGILTQSWTNAPIQEVSSIKTAWNLDIATTTGSFVANFTDKDNVTWTGLVLWFLKDWWWKSCKEILNKYPSKKWYDGIYIINPTWTWSFQAYCDMTTDWGGWTLVAYAWTINWTRENDWYWILMFNFWNYNYNAINNNISFSRFDLFKNIANYDSEFLAKRSSNADNILIFPIVNVSWFWRSNLEWHFTINSSNRDIPYIKLSNSWNLWIKKVTNNIFWTYNNSSSSNFPWINRNITDWENCDNCWRNFETWLNHRSLLYWQITGVSYESNQRFHAQPLSMKDSTWPDNSVQDIEFYFR